MRSTGVSPVPTAGAKPLTTPLKLSISLENLNRIDEPAFAVSAEQTLGSAPDTTSPTTAPSDEEEEERTPDEVMPLAPWAATPAESARHAAAGDTDGDFDGTADKEDGEEDPSSAKSGKGSVRKQAWTAEEDAKLLELVERHGPSNWSRIAADLPSRIGKQCRERWHNHLSPSVKKEVRRRLLASCPRCRRAHFSHRARATHTHPPTHRHRLARFLACSLRQLR